MANLEQSSAGFLEELGSGGDYSLVRSPGFVLAFDGEVAELWIFEEAVVMR